MNKLTDVLIKTRIKLLENIEGLTADQLNFIPAGFSNNIIWNLGHLISAQQGLCYLRAGQPMLVADAIRNEYAPGTRPERTVNQAEITEIKQLLVSTIEQLDTDIAAGLFNSYTPWVNRHDIELNTINDVLCYLPFHDGLHADRIAAYKRLIAVTY